jgi:uncharacterized NAD(P)/FAD-binding protein YdhS
MQRITIIGGGASGAAVVGEFLRHGSHVALTWLVGAASDIGRGIAYATRNEQHLLNVRAANMGLFADDPDALLRFAHARGLAAKPTDFLPRGIFGDYVESTLARLTKVHSADCSLDVRHVEATALDAIDAGGYRVSTDHGADVIADAVVLAIGAPPPLPLAQIDAQAQDSGRYVLDPWRIPELTLAPQRVVVLGSGLTAADMILSAANQWPQAQIVALSRRGHLPRTHRAAPSPPYPCQRELIDAMHAQPNVRSWMRLIRESLNDNHDWRAVIDGLRSQTASLWQSLDVAERRRFLRHARWLWELARHRMPPQAAESIEQLRDEGRLDLIAGRVRRVTGRSPLALTFRRREDGSEQTLAADLVIQATGFEGVGAQTSHPLLRQMLDSCLVRADAVELGLQSDPDGRLLRADGTAAPDLRVVGTLLRGTTWECTALPEIRASAARIVRSLPNELRRARDGGESAAGFWTATSRHIDMAIEHFGT